jgi:hypothetical protein
LANINDKGGMTLVSVSNLHFLKNIFNRHFQAFSGGRAGKKRKKFEGEEKILDRLIK